MSTNLGDIFTGIGNAFAGIAKGYQAIIVGQAESGMFDIQSKSLNTSIDLTKQATLEAKKQQADVKTANLIKNKVSYKQYITQDEYNFLVGMGYDLGLSYEGYIDYISNQNSSVILSENNTQDNKMKTTVNIKPYLLLASLGLVGTYLIFRRK